MENEKKQYVSGSELFPLIIEQLEQGKRVCFTVSGSSMMPWIVNNRDSVELISAKNIQLKKGDIILFQPLKHKYVLHRIIKVCPTGYLTAGDGNLYADGIASKKSVIAKAVSIRRKGKEIDCEKIRWKIVFHIWMLLFPVRGYLLKGIGGMGRFRRSFFLKR